MTDNRPGCFGNIDEVFPMTEKGYRESPEKCIKSCDFKKECIVYALDSKKGIAKKDEMIDAAYEAGNINFFSRWSQKKTVHDKYEVKKSTLRKFLIFRRGRDK